jgi:hypothetical protein
MILEVSHPDKPNVKATLKAILDSGDEVGNLITEECIVALGLSSKVERDDKVIGRCTCGRNISSTGTLVLQLNGDRLSKLLELEFFVVRGDSLPWELFIGAESCYTYHFLKPGIFGTVVAPKMSEGTMYYRSIAYPLVLTNFSRKKGTCSANEEAP